MVDIIDFPKRERSKGADEEIFDPIRIWSCPCGCASFYIREDLHIFCIRCNILIAVLGAGDANLPPKGA